MPTRLKRLELHGFKSFATPTTFVLDPAMTAIIGPNGSGKSNIADALRWVLGEQSYATLRGRRTEDVIFVGGSGRAPLGMAEVAVTLDNQDGSLPLPFTEVTVTRRAFRSGENQYLINGARVRLKDVLQVTAALGQAYTIIGQGLVDEVLSRRPEQRRGLFEHAAGISGLRLKYADAQRSLEESRANSQRLADILAEIEPRLHSLERAARQAREARQVRAALSEALTRLYAIRYRQAVEQLTAASDALAAAEAEVASTGQAVEAAAASLAGAEAERVGRERSAAALRWEADTSRAACREVEHALALTQERRNAAAARHADLRRSLDELRNARVAIDGERERHARELGEVGDALADRERAVAVMEAQRRDAASEHARRRQALDAAERRLIAIDREIAAMDGRAALLAEQEAEAIRALDQIDAAAREREERRVAITREIEQQERERDAATQHCADLLAERERADAARRALAAERDALTTEATRLEARRVEARTRLETLQRLRDSGAGLYAGVRAVLDASRQGRLQGIVGTVASLLDVPSLLETAVEVALGSHVQDIVVERWADAEQAIAHLRRERAGRATFQPLDTLRPPSPTRPLPAGVAGTLGIARDLIGCDPRIAPVVDSLLGRVAVTESLEATRALLPRLPGGWSVVTLDGDIARASGTVTGGSQARESGAIARERELRDLPRLCREIETDLAAVRERLAAADRDLAALASRIATIERHIREMERAGEAASDALDRARRALADLERDDAAARTRREQAEQRVAAIAVERAAIGERRRALDDARREALAETERIREAIASRESEADTEQLDRARSTLSELRERRRGLVAEGSRLAARRDELARQIAAVERRLASAETDLADLQRSEGEQATRLAALRERLREMDDRLGPLAGEIDRAQAAEQRLRQQVAAEERRAREAERERDRLALERERRQDAVSLVLERARRDLEMDDVPAALDGVPPMPADDLPRLEQTIDRLRGRLRRVGLVGDDAVEQYEREAERYQFLSRQLDDVRQAADALRALLTELDHAMTEAFDRTFGEVADAFAATFTAIFGGGKARLVRVGDESGNAGVEIVAQPPGKRLQALELLSGGERALTAVALLFAILKARPSPFCLLDEVDAALDEANVVRVRDMLRELARTTQFIVVTHNRATIEGADALYGITMGDDGVSQVLSLRLVDEATD